MTTKTKALSLILQVYKILVPVRAKNIITMKRNKGGLNDIRKSILSYYGTDKWKSNSEVQEVTHFLKTNPLAVFPYTFTRKYKAAKVQIHFDISRQLNYVVHEGKKMYFKKSWTKKDIRENYTNLLREQDVTSPHRYLSSDFNIKLKDTVADIGAAEGIFSLPLIEEIGKLYLFENDLEWIEALEATFYPWKDKVVIVKKFVSNNDYGDSISLDKFASERNIKFDFIKIDVDGAEERLLKGAKTILANKAALNIAICTYHKQGDENMVKSLLSPNGFHTETSNGFMIFIYDKTLAEPFLRRGVVRATKKITDSEKVN